MGKHHNDIHLKSKIRTIEATFLRLGVELIPDESGYITFKDICSGEHVSLIDSEDGKPCDHFPHPFEYKLGKK